MARRRGRKGGRAATPAEPDGLQFGDGGGLFGDGGGLFGDDEDGADVPDEGEYPGTADGDTRKDLADTMTAFQRGRVAATSTGIPHRSADRLIKKLVSEERLVLVRAGVPSKIGRKAGQYRLPELVA